MSTHPLSTARLIERAATASDEPDHHHVTAAYHAQRVHYLLADRDGCTTEDFDYDLAADVAALEMAHAAAASLARRLYDRSDDPRIATFLYGISTHYAGQLDYLLADLERNTDHAAHLTP